MRFKLISCDVFTREIEHVVSRSPHRVDTEFLPRGLHDLGAERMASCLQNAVGGGEAGAFDAVLLGYGLCGRGIDGLRAGTCPLVVPRAHDCLTLFLGSRRRYAEVFHRHPGTYYLTPGWMERGETDEALQPFSVRHRTGLDRTRRELVEAYGEDNARYLEEQLGNPTRHYTRMAFIETGVEPNDKSRREAERRARDRGLDFASLRGDLRLLRRLVDGDWAPEDFLVVPAGRRIAVAEDGCEIVVSEGAS